MIEDYLPEWAEARVGPGSYMEINASLPTRDGRRTGNAMTFSHFLSRGEPCVRVVTDAGNILVLNWAELKELYYPPEFLMREPLPAAKAAIERWRDEQRTKP